MLSNKNITGFKNASDFNFNKKYHTHLSSQQYFPAHENQFTSSFLNSKNSIGTD